MNSRKRVTSLEEVFFKCKDPKQIKEWYSRHPGLNRDDYGTSFEWRQADEGIKKGFTVWSPFAQTTPYFESSTKEFTINYRVEDPEWPVTELKKRGVPY